jgi:hypothetical protein
VALHWKAKKIGYIPRDQNEVIARLMDAGKQFKGTLTDIDYTNDWNGLEVDIFLKD